MPKKWEGLERPPKGAKADETMRWFGEHVYAFQSENPDLSQDFIGDMSNANRNKVIRAYHKVRNAAELEEAKKQGAEYAKVVERYQRTGVIKTTVKKKKRK